MANREERIRLKAEKHASREERVEGWLDRNMNRKGMRPRYAAYLVIAVWLIAIVSFGIVQRIVDPDTYPNIWLAWWWAIQTVTTVGYGDVAPKSTEGRAVAAVLMIAGIASISLVTATISAGFVRRTQDRRSDSSENRVLEALARIEGRLDDLERRIAGDDADADERS
jgi:voltage-gated potassium channel Kch